MSMPDQVDLLANDSEAAPSLSSNNFTPSTALPDEPLIKVRASDSHRLINFGELWAHHELCYFLVWRDLKLRYKQAVLGSAWVILQPILMTIVFTIFLGKLVRVSSDGLPYAIFAYAGLLPWIFLSNAVTTSSQSLIGNATLITKVYFPRLLIPLSAIIVRVADFIIASFILLALLGFYGIRPGWSILLFPAFVFELTLLAIALGLWSAAMNVKYRDVGTLLPVALQLWMFASPIVYPASLVPEKWRVIYSLNPLVGIIEGMRAALFNGSFHWQTIIVSSLLTLALLFYAIYSFSRTEEDFADVV